jgi:hypothetical protein
MGNLLSSNPTFMKNRHDYEEGFVSLENILYNGI